MSSSRWIVGVVLCVGLSTAYAEEEDEADSSIMIGISPTYSQGNYGTDTNTQLRYFPVFIKYQRDEASIKLTVPYVSQESKGNTLISGGTVVGTITKGTTTNATTRGLGDIWLEGRYQFESETAGWPDISPYVKIKFGTAKPEDNLGTRKNDYEAGFAFEWSTTRFFPFMEMGYRKIGQPDNATLRDIGTADVGVTDAINDKHFVTVIYSWQQAQQQHRPAPTDIMISWSYKRNDAVTWQLYTDAGLTDGSPAFMIGLGVQKKYEW